MEVGDDTFVCRDQSEYYYMIIYCETDNSFHTSVEDCETYGCGECIAMSSKEPYPNSVEEMILIPNHNVHGLNLTELKKIKEQVLTELSKR